MEYDALSCIWCQLEQLDTQKPAASHNSNYQTTKYCSVQDESEKNDS